MPTLVLSTAAKKDYKIRLPEPSLGQRSAYFFAFAKSGSTLMDNMLSAYCGVQGIAFFSLFGQAFSQGLRTAEVGEEALVCFQPEGYVYSGFRHYPEFTLPITDEPVVLLVRDPRDMLVSLYYSVTRSHVIPKGNKALQAERERANETTIDEFVLNRGRGYLGQFRRYQKQLEGKNLRTYRYEDIIYNKTDWLRQLIDFAGLPVNRKLIKKVALNYDVVPGDEQESEHIRQVHPGNYRKKLKAETIEQLSEQLHPFLSAYGYQ